MDNINLYEKAEQRKRGGSFLTRSLGTMLALVLFVLTGFAYYGVKWWSGDYDRRIQDTQLQEQAARDNFDRQTANEVNDLYLRLNDMKSRQEAQGALEGMELVEKNILAGVVLSQYEYSNDEVDKKLEISGDAENLNVLGQQLAQLRSIDTIQNITLEKMGVSDTGFILFTVNVTL